MEDARPPSLPVHEELAALRRQVTALHAAQDVAAHIVETVRTPLLVLTSDFRVHSANPAFYQLFQLRPAETEGQSIYAVDQRQWDMPDLRILLEEILPRQSSFSDYAVTQDFARLGRRTMLLNARRLDQEQLILLAMEDITHRMDAETQAHEALRVANARVKLILDSITDQFFAVDHEWRYTYFNPQAEVQLKALGLDPARLLGTVLWEAFPHPTSEAELRRAMAERVMNTDEQYFPPLGQWYENRIYPSPDGGLAIFQRYITERKEAEAALRRSEASLAQAQRLSHTGSGSWNVVTGDVAWSDETYRIYGFEPGSVPPSYDVFFTLVHPEDRLGLEQAFAQVAREQCAYEFDFRILRPDDTLRYIHSAGEPLFDAAGALVGILGTVVDITERKQAEDALHEAQAALAHVTRVLTLGALMTSIAHEVNQPLAAILTNAQAGLLWLGRATPDLVAGREALQAIVTNSQRAGDIIARLRTTVQKAPPHLGPLDLPQVIAEVVALTHHEVQQQQVQMRTDVGGDLPLVVGDRIQVQQVLLNLVLNGLDALRPILDRPRTLLIRAGRLGAETVRVTVQDSGIGVDPPMLERMFAPFVTTKPAGLGMGLAISRTIIEAHGGRLWAEPHADHGITVHFTLPTAGEHAHA